ncbi:hypothetical protein [Elizabethkingia miricola]|uniref:hypothetical protein n=1 Tax=Elizabethkingia miricola TaxID=172045 RepID=UPI0038923FDC
MRRFRFYLIGLIPGIIIVFFILNQKGTSCSYFPNDRVVAETLTKDFVLTPDFQQELKAFNLNEKFLKDSIVSKGKIDFDRSEAQKQPCPKYLLFYPSKKPVYEVQYEKCKKNAQFINIKKIN